MKIKKLLTGICIVILIASLNITAFGASVESTPLVRASESNAKIIEDVTGKFETAKKNDSNMKAKAKAIMDKWNALSDVQKEEIYKLKDVSIDVECRIIEKYLEFGIIDTETAANLKAKKTEYKSEMRKSGKLPGYGIKFKTGK